MNKNPSLIFVLCNHKYCALVKALYSEVRKKKKTVRAEIYIFFFYTQNYSPFNLLTLLPFSNYWHSVIWQFLSNSELYLRLEVGQEWGGGGNTLPYTIYFCTYNIRATSTNVWIFTQSRQYFYFLKIEIQCILFIFKLKLDIELIHFQIIWIPVFQLEYFSIIGIICSFVVPLMNFFSSGFSFRVIFYFFFFKVASALEWFFISIFFSVV